MKEIKIRYTWREKESGRIYQVVQKIEWIEFAGYSSPSGDELIARDLWIEKKDKDGIDIFEGDIIFAKWQQIPWKQGYFEYPTGAMIITNDYFPEFEGVVKFIDGILGVQITKEIFHAWGNISHDYEIQITGNIHLKQQ